MKSHTGVLSTGIKTV